MYGLREAVSLPSEENIFLILPQAPLKLLLSPKVPLARVQFSPKPSLKEANREVLSLLFWQLACGGI